MRNDRDLYITIAICVIVLLLVYLLMFRGCVDYLVSEMEKKNYERINLPNGYAVVKIHVGRRVVCDDIGSIIVEQDIKEIGWNDRYVIYKRICENNTTETGLIDTVESTVCIINESELDKRLKQIGIEGKIDLTKVEDLFPETRGF